MMRRVMMLGFLVLVLGCGGGDDDVEPETSDAPGEAVISPAASPTTGTSPTAVVGSPTRGPATEAVVASPISAASPTALIAPSDIEVRIMPEQGTYGDVFTLEVSGLEPNAQYVVVIEEPTGQLWTDEVRANVTGDGLEAQHPMSGSYEPYDEFWYSERHEPPGVYTVELRATDRQTVLAEATFTIHE